MNAIALTVLGLTVPALGQTFFTAAAPTPFNLTTTLGLQSQTTVFGGSGPLAPGAVSSVQLPSGEEAYATVQWQAYATPDEVGISLLESGLVSSTQLASATIGLHDIVFQLNTTSTSTQIRFSITRFFNATQGVPVPLLEIDLFDDGIIEATGVGSTPLHYTVLTALGSLRVRVRAACNLPPAIGDRSFDLALSIRATPVNSLNVLPALPGCTVGELRVRPAWDVDGIALSSPDPTLASAWPLVVVLGLGTNLLTLAPPTPSLPLVPCLLLPTPDLLLLLPWPNALLLPIPAAARPLAIWAQGVLVASPSLETTDASVVLAN